MIFHFWFCVSLQLSLTFMNGESWRHFLSLAFLNCPEIEISHRPMFNSHINYKKHNWLFDDLQL